jgi:hypothetical protein
VWGELASAKRDGQQTGLQTCTRSSAMLHVMNARAVAHWEKTYKKTKKNDQQKPPKLNKAEKQNKLGT